MKILFVENRYMTHLWKVVAAELKKEGHQIFWLIQNHTFKPQNEENVFVIPYFKGNLNGIKKEYTEGVKKAIKADRGLNFFGVKNDDHFFYYKLKINEYIDKIKPSVVFGESTLFHELLTIESCRLRDIPYFSPSVVRYPTNRFSFYAYDTRYTPYGSEEPIEIAVAENLIDSIVHRKVVPHYMRAKPMAWRKKLADKLQIAYAHFSGEKFNTPSIWQKFKLGQLQKKQILEWDNLALDDLAEDTKFRILYPIHLQPEANIDVWGIEYMNQAATLRSVADLLDDNTTLYLKPNPKAKYEYNNGLLELIKTHPKIRVLKHNTKMGDLFPKVDLILTVNGTVSIEAIVSNKPVAMLCEPFFGGAKNCAWAQKLTDLLPIIESVRTKTFPTLEQVEKIAYFDKVSRNSFQGIIGNGFGEIMYLENKDNMNQVFSAFRTLLSKIDNYD